MPEGLSAESAGCEALRASRQADEIRSALSRERSDLDNALHHRAQKGHGNGKCKLNDDFDIVTVARLLRSL